MSIAIPQVDYRLLYRKLRLIRRAEEEIARIYPSDKIKSPVHLSIGQEAVSVGVCDPLRPDDVVSGTYRSHASYMAKGGTFGRFSQSCTEKIQAVLAVRVDPCTLSI